MQMCFNILKDPCSWGYLGGGGGGGILTEILLKYDQGPRKLEQN
jgi:hypothetical protein